MEQAPFKDQKKNINTTGERKPMEEETGDTTVKRFAAQGTLQSILLCVPEAISPKAEEGGGTLRVYRLTDTRV